MSDTRPIGVFDSGIGGLTVVKALRDVLPNENIFYLGDTARVPYGNKSAETVERYAIELADILTHENAKVLVVACNTVSSVAIPKLGAHISVPVVGVIEPGAQARSLGENVTIGDPGQNCATAVRNLLDRQSLRSTSTNGGSLRVALTDAADNFLNVARDALQLEIGQVELRALA